MDDEQLIAAYEKARKALEEGKKNRSPDLDLLRKEWMRLQYQMKLRKLKVGKWLSYTASLVTQTSRKVRYLRNKYSNKRATPPKPGTELQHMSGRRVSFSGMDGELAKLSDGRRLTLSKLARDYGWSGKEVKASTIGSAAEKLATLGYEFLGGKQSAPGQLARYRFKKGSKEVVLDSAQVKKLLRAVKASQGPGRGKRGFHSLLPMTPKGRTILPAPKEAKKYPKPTLADITSIKIGATESFGGYAALVTRIDESTYSTNMSRTRNHNRLTAQEALADVLLKMKDIMASNTGNNDKIKAEYSRLKALPTKELERLVGYSFKGSRNFDAAKHVAINELIANKFKISQDAVDNVTEIFLSNIEAAQSLYEDRSNEDPTYKRYKAEYRKLQKAVRGLSISASAAEEDGCLDCTFPDEKSARSFAAEAMAIPGAKVTCSGKKVSCSYPKSHGAAVMASAGKYHAPVVASNSRKARYEAFKATSIVASKKPGKVTSIGDLRHKASSDSVYQKLAIDAAQNLGGNPKTWQVARNERRGDG